MFDFSVCNVLLFFFLQVVFTQEKWRPKNVHILLSMKQKVNFHHRNMILIGLFKRRNGPKPWILCSLLLTLISGQCNWNLFWCNTNKNMFSHFTYTGLVHTIYFTSSWNQPVQSSECKVCCSWKPWMDLNVFLTSNPDVSYRSEVPLCPWLVYTHC